MDPRIKIWIGLFGALMVCGFLAILGVVDSVESRSFGDSSAMYGDLAVAQGFDRFSLSAPGGTGAPQEGEEAKPPAVSQPPPVHVPDWSEVPPTLDPAGLKVETGIFEPTPSAREVFDAFFAYFGFAHPELVRGRIGLYALETLPPGAGTRCLEVLDLYTELISRERSSEDLGPVARAELRVEVLGRDLAQALYADELASVAMSRAPSPPAAASNFQVVPSAAKAPRAEELGPPVAHDWAERMDAYRVRRSQILSDPKLDAVAREDLLEDERVSRFQPHELGRVRDFDRIESLSF